MNRNDFKQVLKPLIKECIKEVLFEDGVLSGVISEVVKGLGANTIVEAKQELSPAKKQIAEQQSDHQMRKKLNETRKQMLDAIGQGSYNGVNVFEGTTPAPSAQEPSNGPLAGTEPNDPGVDISGLVGISRGNWKELIK
jgi:hypothetical protein